MPRFSINLTDEYGQGYSVWESDDTLLRGLGRQLDSLTAALDESRQPRSGQLEEIIRDLRGHQICRGRGKRRHHDRPSPIWCSRPNPIPPGGPDINSPFFVLFYLLTPWEDTESA